MAEITPPAFLSFSPIALYTRKLLRKLHRPITFYPTGRARGRVLLSYVAHPFCITRDELLRSPHTNPWETLLLTEVLLHRGYIVDVIDWTNRSFTPRKSYDLLIDIHRNLERLAPLMPGAKKVFYATGAYWKFNNEAEQDRLSNVEARRGVTLVPRRNILPEATEHADHILVLSAFAASTYERLRKPTTILPLFPTVFFPAPHKDWESIRKNFMFISGGGAVHKGLDLVLEAFATLPDYSLTICGPVIGEEDFAEAYARELSLPNIHTTGRINIRSEAFKAIADSSVGLVYPSCSEGQAGSVLTGLSAGLIPITTPQSGVDTRPFGLALTEPTVDTVREAVMQCASLAVAELEQRAAGAWSSIQQDHMPAHFTASFTAFLDSLSL